MNVSTLLAVDALDEAVAAAVATVKARPQDGAARIILAELAIIEGDYARAEVQAQLAARTMPSDIMGLALLRQRLRGLDARRAWWTAQALPLFPQGPTAADQQALALNVALAAGNADAVRDAAARLEDLRGTCPVHWNGTAQDDLRDVDDRLPHAIEAVTAGGNYLWIDLALIREIAFDPPARLLDLVCRKAKVTLHEGSVAEVWVPAIYPDPSGPAQMLGRETEFTDVPGGIVTAHGQRSFLVGDDMQGILDATLIVLADHV
jgi:type VI secretion system protein ImpE